jgi:hypothetical protein
MAPARAAGEVILEERVATNPEAMKKAFSTMPRSRIALETGTHSPWVSRVLSELGHEAIVARTQCPLDRGNVQAERLLKVHRVLLWTYSAGGELSSGIFSTTQGRISSCRAAVSPD